MITASQKHITIDTEAEIARSYIIKMIMTAEMQSKENTNILNTPDYYQYEENE